MFFAIAGVINCEEHIRTILVITPSLAGKQILETLAKAGHAFLLFPSLKAGASMCPYVPYCTYVVNPYARPFFKSPSITALGVCTPFSKTDCAI